MECTPNRESLLALIQPNMKLTREFLKRIYSFELSYPSFSEQAIDALEGILSEVQQEFSPEDPKAGIIQNWLDNCKYDSVCSLMIYKEALGNE